MTPSEQVNALMATAQQLAEQATNNADLANRLVAEPAETIVAAAGQPIPAGIKVTATHGADGAVEVTFRADADFDGELDDAMLDSVAGGIGLSLAPLTPLAIPHSSLSMIRLARC